MKIVYIAGKYRGESWNDVWDNITHARAEARKLWLQGFAVICPHANSIFMDGVEGETDNVFLRGDLEILSRCDSIYMLKGWEESVGARKELELAESLALEVIYESWGGGIVKDA